MLCRAAAVLPVWLALLLKTTALLRFATCCRRIRAELTEILAVYRAASYIAGVHLPGFALDDILRIRVLFASPWEPPHHPSLRARAQATTPIPTIIFYFPFMPLCLSLHARQQISCVETMFPMSPPSTCNTCHGCPGCHAQLLQPLRGHP